MALVKSLLLISAASSALVAICLGENKKLVGGQHVFGETSELNATVAHGISWLFGRGKTYEEWFNVTKGHVITYFEAINEAPDGGTEVSVLEGGVGQNGVKLQFKTEWFHGVYYKVQLFGKPEFQVGQLH